MGRTGWVGGTSLSYSGACPSFTPSLDSSVRRTRVGILTLFHLFSLGGFQLPVRVETGMVRTGIDTHEPPLRRDVRGRLGYNLGLHLDRGGQRGLLGWG